MPKLPDALMPALDGPAFLAGSGEMATLMRGHDWAASPLGEPALWPQSLRTVVRLMLNTGHPMYVWWGPELTCLYNDAYRESIGPERHPVSLGRPAREVWGEIWDLISPQIEQVMGGGGATWHVDHLVPITRHGRREDVYWTYSYSPIDEDTAPGGIGGVLVVCTETTQQVQTTRQLIAERDRWASMFAQAPTFMAVLDGPEHRFEIANPAYLQVVGHRPLLGMTVAEALPEAVEQGYVALLDRVYTSGEAYAATGAVYAAAPSPGGPVSERVVDFVYQPIRAADGSVSGIFVQGADITDRAMTEHALRESESRFRSALNAGRMGAWETDYEAGTRTWTPEGMALFGIDLPDGRGQVGGPDDEYASALHPDYRHLAAGFRELADRQDSFAAEYWITRPDGTRLWLSGRGMVLSRGADGRAHRLVSIMADTTERKLAEQRLQVEHERLELALGAGRMGAFDMQIPDGVLWWSAQTYRLFGVSEQGFVPTPDKVLALMHPDDREGFSDGRAESLAQGRPFVHEFRIRRPDGSQAWLGHRGHAEYDADGVPVRSFGITMDITERKQAEQALQDADRQKDRFIAMLAHELRNPLAPIRNAVGVLRKSGAADAAMASWCHDVIERQVGQMAHLLDDLLDASRLKQGQLRLRLERLALAIAIDRAVEIARPAIDAAGHLLSLRLADEALVVEGDLTRLAQVFSNILINAAKYTPRAGAIELTVERQAGSALVRITDNGIGLDARHLDHIFEMFGQVESSLNRSDGGQGIGLALAKALVEMHGGTIAALSDGLARGSRFEVRLPLAAEPAAAAMPGADSRDDAGAASAWRVMVVDDSRDSADTLALAVEALGHSVEVAYGGEAALARAEALRPDAMLLDLGMPGIDGYELCRRIRATPWGGAVVLIAQTGWGGERDRQKTRDAGFDHHVVKPVDLGVLDTLLQRR